MGKPKIRLAIIAGDRMIGSAISLFRENCEYDIEVAFELGKKQADFFATSLSRITAREAHGGHLMKGKYYSGVAEKLFVRPDYFVLRDEFTQHMTRNSDSTKLKSHALNEINDYHTYYHILCDALALEVSSRCVTHVVFTNIPHLGYDTALHHVAIGLGLPVVILSQSLFPNKIFSLMNPKDYGAFRANPISPAFQIKRDENKEWFYMKGVAQDKGHHGRLSVGAVIQFIVYLFRKHPLRMLNPVYLFRVLKRMRRIYEGLPAWRDPFARFFHEDSLAYFEHLCEFENQEINLDGDFVYFPLQLQPEMTTSALGGLFVDQAYAIERLAALLPPGVRILVKENPKQGAYMRGPLFFHRLRRIPAATFLPSWVNTHELTRKSRFVATVTGTAGWEAICKGKPVLVFGRAWYRGLPGVVEYRDGLTYNEIASLEWEHSALEQASGALIQRCHDGIIDPAYVDIVPNFDEKQNASKIAALIAGLLHGSLRPTFEEVHESSDINVSV